MILIEYHVENPSGFHARPVSMLVKEACKYQSAITFEKNGKVINCKSMMSVLSAAVGVLPATYLRQRRRSSERAPTGVW